MKKAYWLLDLKSLDNADRTFEGIASTPSVDRMGDIVEPKGAIYTLPLPMMWQHGLDDIKDPIGWIIDAKVTKSGIAIKGKIANLDSPPTLKEDLDRAWALISSKLVRGLSIGFNPIAYEEIEGSWGLRFTSWEWLELSPVAIAANQDSMITTFRSMSEFEKSITVKSADQEALAALGRERTRSVRLDGNRPGVSGHSSRHTMKTIQEQIATSEAKLTANEARIDAIIAKTIEEGRTPETEENDEIEILRGQSKSLTDYIALLKSREADMVRRAARPTAENTVGEDQSAGQRNGQARRDPILVRSNAPKGIAVARAAIALIRAKGIPFVAEQYAKQYWPDNPEIGHLINMKTAVEAGDTTTSGWASQLIPGATAAGEFLDLLRPATLIGRIPGLRRVPFNVAVPVQTGGGTYQWVGEAAAKPVSGLTFTSATLRWAKAAGIIVITQELARFSDPSAEMIVRDDMIAGMAKFLDEQFITPTVAEVSQVSPGAITQGISPTVATGTSAAYFRVDMTTLLKKFTANNVDPSTLVVLMSASQAMALGLMTNALGQAEFPNISVNGGTILQLPVIVSESVGARIVVISARDILMAEDGGLVIDVSTEASVEMADASTAIGDTSPIVATTVIKSFWQNNLVGLRVERFQTWKRGRAAAVEYISTANYVQSAT